MKIKTLKEIKELISDARHEAKTEARRGYRFKCLFSRGTHLCTASNGDQCSPQPEAEAYEWKGNLGQIKTLIADVEANYPEVDEVYIAGGYDGADSPHEYYKESYYDSWVGEWSVTVWTREK